MELESYKKEKLAEAGQEIIPDLVHGSTKEEIDQTVELAKQRYEIGRASCRERVS